MILLKCLLIADGQYRLPTVSRILSSRIAVLASKRKTPARITTPASFRIQSGGRQLAGKVVCRRESSGVERGKPGRGNKAAYSFFAQPDYI